MKDLLELAVLPFIPDFSTCPRLAAGIVFSARKAMASALPVVGLEIDLAVGMVVGVVAVTALYFWGWEHWTLKGLAVGALAWTVIDITLSRLLSNVPPPQTVLEAELGFLVHFAFGVALVGSSVIMGWKLERTTG